MTNPAPSDMQTVVQVNVYRIVAGQPEFLLLQRNDDHDAFWQPISQPVGDDGDIAAAIKQALRQQAGLTSFKHLSAEMYTYEWYAHGQQGKDVVFAVEVAAQTPVVIDSQRYRDHIWLGCDQAVEHLKWQGNRDALRRLQQRIERELREHPLPPSAMRASQPAAAIPQAQTGIDGWPGQSQSSQPAIPEPYQQPELQANVIPLPVYEGPDAPPPPPQEAIPGNQKAPDIPLPPQDQANYPFSPRQNQ